MCRRCRRWFPVPSCPSVIIFMASGYSQYCLKIMNDHAISLWIRGETHTRMHLVFEGSRLLLKCDGTRAETRFDPSPKRTSPFKSAGASVQSTAGSRGVRISGSNAGYTMFRGSVKGTVYPRHSPVSPSLLLSCVTVGHHISTGVYQSFARDTVAFLVGIVLYRSVL